ncbi:glucuronate isomerase [Maribacter algarum]|uniref:Uronate isomerase n=1 Tax=Maribacter algarum (ex Zhang et al. 2020) TaxID=2578118 RepID=A0A5S3PTT1_9FLAO|nr:glucuronate isomerase [Maribacter algarum]TMM58419.1 glucuronate isomerase [Maribacter algarum]
MHRPSKFIHDNFLLENTFAEELYHEYACKMPIIDYHNHLPPNEIAENKIFENISQIWISGDHYKWRAMRTLGINEKYITGSASDQEKFQRWGHTVPYTMRNPLYHWTHMELDRYFGISDLLDSENADQIYNETAQKLSTEAFSVQSLLTKMNVESLCTTDDPTDSLEHHQKLSKSDFKTKVSMAFRPDKAIFIGSDSYKEYLNKLAQASEITIDSYDSLCDALRNRVVYFHANGCRLCDHGFEHMYAEAFTETEVKTIFKKKHEGLYLSKEEVLKYQSALLLFLSELYHEFGWVQQFHLGALRNNNSRMLEKLGPDTGWDSIGDFQQASSLSKFLNTMDSKNKLAKTVIYNNNPTDNNMMAAMIGNFNDGSIKGKVQFGSGWWFMDQKEGMIDQMNALSNIGLLSCFIGMLTDSRSFLSFPRHEYFRRILCNLFGKDIQNGELPIDMKWIGKMVQDICYNNAKGYFEF